MKPCILFLDDEETMCDLVSDFFRQKGCEVATATTGRKAMDLAHQRSFDLAIFDINVAGENGLELLTYFKNNFPALPVIMFTGIADNDELLDQARLRGASGFMCKTDPLDDLFAAVRTYLPPA